MKNKKLIFSFCIPLLVFGISYGQVNDPQVVRNNFCESVNRVLFLGNQSEEVSQLQGILKQEVNPLLGSTGYFGSYTKRVVAAFQWQNGIFPVGSVGPVTLNKMRSLWCPQGNPSSVGVDNLFIPTNTPSGTSNTQSTGSFQSGDVVDTTYTTDIASSQNPIYQSTTIDSVNTNSTVSTSSYVDIVLPEVISPEPQSSNQTATYTVAVTPNIATQTLATTSISVPNQTPISTVKSYSLSPCPTSSSLCLFSSNTVLTSFSNSKECTYPVSHSLIVPVRAIGDHTGDGIDELAITYCEDTSSTYNGKLVQRTVLRIFNPQTNQSLAVTKSPNSTGNALSLGTQYLIYVYSDVIAGPGNKLYPFIAPGYGENNTGGQTPAWGALCLYRPGATASTVCGANFATVTTSNPTVLGVSEFLRESTGYIWDVDKDGWQDINLIYHKLIYTISGRLAKPLASIVYDVAKTDEPNSPAWFHSGRNNAMNYAFVGDDGKDRVAAVGGNQVGQFSDNKCNVTRWVGMMEETTASPYRRWLWTKYYGFYANTITNPYDIGNPQTSRKGDFNNKCIHYASDGTDRVGGKDVLVFNIFTEASVPSTARCATEQQEFYRTNNSAAWEACLDRTLSNTYGYWSTEVLLGRNGDRLSRTANSYIWGSATNIIPGQGKVYIREKLASSHNIRLDTIPSQTLVASVLQSDGSWLDLGTVSVPGRPKLQIVKPSGSRGQGDNSGYRELITEDRNGDGVREILFTNSSRPSEDVWVSWRGETKTLSNINGTTSQIGAISCLFDTDVLQHGSSVLAYQKSSVPAGASCLSETVTCNNGQLTGTYRSASCKVENPTAGATKFMFEGDSMSSLSSSGNFKWSELMDSQPGFENATYYNYAVGGQKASQMVPQYDIEAGRVKPSSGQKAFFSLWAGTNDLVNSTDSAQTIFNNLKSLWMKARVDGYKVVAFTITPGDRVRESVRLQLNDLISNSSQYYDALIRVDHMFPSQYSSDFKVDNLHLSADGNKKVANKVASVLSGLLFGGGTVDVPDIPGCSFVIYPSTVKVGELFTLEWSSVGATSVMLRNQTGTEYARALSGKSNNSISKAGKYYYSIIVNKTANKINGDAKCDAYVTVN